SLHGCEVTVAGRHAERRALLPDGAAFTDGLLEPRGAPGGQRGAFDLAVDATGTADVLPLLLPLVRPRGTVVLKTTTERPTTADLSLLVVNELRLCGSRCGRFAAALAALQRGAVPVERLIAGRYPLAQGATAFAHAGRKGTLKILLQISGGRR